LKKIRIILESDKCNIGWIITPETQNCIAGVFDENNEFIIEKSQDGKIENQKEFCQQIYFTLLTSIKNNG